MIKRSEISRYKVMLNYLTDSNRKETENAINEYYQRINEMVSESEKKTRENFKVLCEAQKDLTINYQVFII